MAGGNRRKCKCCLTFFRPDPRNRNHQRYCSAAACRAASKATSQARWLAAPENQGYFRGPVNVARVQAWRSCHPGYWRRARRVGMPLQDLSMAQLIAHISNLLVHRPDAQHILRCRAEQRHQIAFGLAQPERPVIFFDDDWHAVLDHR